MGHFDILADASFRKTADGRVIYVPGGVFGRGYEVPTKEKYDEIRTYVKHLMIACVPLGAVAAVSGWPFVLLALSGLYVAHKVRVRSLTRGLAEVEQTSTLTQRMKESYRRQAAMSSSARLWLLEIGVVLLLVMCIAILLSHPEAKGDPGLIFLIVLFGVCAVAAGYMIRVKHGLAGKPDPFDLP